MIVTLPQVASLCLTLSGSNDPILTEKFLQDVECPDGQTWGNLGTSFPVSEWEVQKERSYLRTR